MNIATIFSYGANEPDPDANGFINFEEDFDSFDLNDVAFDKLLELTPSTASVNDLESEEDELNFIKAFRDLMRIKNILAAFSDFKWEDVKMSEQLFEDYKSKYLDLYDKVKSNNQKEKVSILDDVDFELELIHREEINVYYIIQLLI